MAIRSQFDTTVSTKRLASVSGSNREEWQVQEASIVCTIHPEIGAQQELRSGAFFATHKMFCGVDEDIEVGDQVIEGTNTYKVTALEKYNIGRTAGNHHLRVALSKGE